MDAQMLAAGVLVGVMLCGCGADDGVVWNERAVAEWELVWAIEDVSQAAVAFESFVAEWGDFYNLRKLLASWLESEGFVEESLVQFRMVAESAEGGRYLGLHSSDSPSPVGWHYHSLGLALERAGDIPGAADAFAYALRVLEADDPIKPNVEDALERCRPGAVKGWKPREPTPEDKILLRQLEDLGYL